MDLSTTAPAPFCAIDSILSTDPVNPELPAITGLPSFRPKYVVDMSIVFSTAGRTGLDKGGRFSPAKRKAP
jgi:hypothetical protein